METRRFVIAMSLSLAVFLLYVRFFAPAPPHPLVAEKTERKEAEADKIKTEQPPRPAALTKTVAANIKQAVRGKNIEIETDLIKATLNTAGGTLTRWELKNYREADKTENGLGVIYKKITGQAGEEKPKKKLGNVQLMPVYPEGGGDLIAPLLLSPDDKELSRLAKVEYLADHDAVRLGADKTNETITLTYRGPAGLEIEKKITFYNDDYRIDIDIASKGIGGYTLSLGTDFGLADKVSKDASGRVGFAASADGKFVLEKIGDIKGEYRQTGDIKWAAQEDKYFTAALIGKGEAVVARKIPASPEIGDLLETELVVRDKPEARKFSLYAGPKAFKILEAHGNGLEQMVDYGWFSVLAKPMFWLMSKFFVVTGNYGLAIILLTIVVRALLFYPSLKSATAMEEMKKIQPQVQAMREKFKKDPQRMNQEMMKLYKEHKVNPLGGCLPMLLQLPFFVALYNVLSVSIELRQSPFISFWIKDLSVYDPYYILPVLMGVSMVFTMKMTSTSVDPQQQKIMMFMNIAFIFLFAWLPSGLLLYITLSNVLSIVQQLYVRRILQGVKPAAL
jgi:YidC/Oxa1 family membrane protein insertase